MRFFRYTVPQLPLLLLVLLVCCAGGCLASVVTYSCDFDKVRRTHGAGSNKVVVMNLPAKEGGGSTTLSVFDKNDWQPIRIEVSTRDVEDKDKYCVFRTGYKPDLLGGKYESCTLEDKLTTKKKETLLQKAIPAAVKLHADRLLVQPLKEKLKVPEFAKGSVCRNFFVPPEHRSDGVDADMVVYAAAAPGGVWALPCAALADGRPVVGVMNFAPAELMYARLATRIAAHLIAHALGFDHRTMAGRNMVANVTGAVRGRRLAVVVNSTNTVMNAKEHYDCNEIYGMELQDMNGDGTKLESHWSQRNARDELMAPIGGGGYYTALTMAAFADLGFYKVNWKMAEPMSWGDKAGCELLEKKCDKLDLKKYPKMFCTGDDRTMRCTSDRYFNGTCSGYIIEMGSGNPWDACPIVRGVKDKIDDNHIFGLEREQEIKRAVQKLRGEYKDPKPSTIERTSWCIDADLTESTSQYDSEGYEKKVEGVMVNVTCATGYVRMFAKGITPGSSCGENDILSFGLRNYAHGTVVCPKYEEVCTISANGSSRLPLIPWDGEEKVYNAKYSKEPLPIPQRSGAESGRGGNAAPKAPPQLNVPAAPVGGKPQTDVDPPVAREPEVVVPQVKDVQTEERKESGNESGSSAISEDGNERSASEDTVRDQEEEEPLPAEKIPRPEMEEKHADPENNVIDAADLKPKDDMNNVTGLNGLPPAEQTEEMVVHSGNATTVDPNTISEGKEVLSPPNTTPATKVNAMNMRSLADTIVKNGGDSTVRGRVFAVLLLLLGFWGVTVLC